MSSPTRVLRPAVFLDRDGVINVEVSYLGDPARFQLLPGVAAAIRRLNQAGLPVIVVTNQSGIGRGYYSLAAMTAVHQRLDAELAAAGAHVDALYFCPHRPEDGCSCRKPAPGMFVQAASELGVDLARSVIIGDKFSDLVAGKAVGCRGVLVLTGHGAEERARGGPLEPEYVAADLPGAVDWWLERWQA